MIKTKNRTRRFAKTKIEKPRGILRSSKIPGTKVLEIFKKNFSGQSLVITRNLNARPAIVFKAWTEPKQVMQWFSPMGFTTPHCTIDLRVGGICHLCMRSPDGRYFWSKGIFREIIEPHRIVRTDSFSDENGNIIPPSEYGLKNWPDETIVTVNFAEYAGRTKLTVQHGPVPAGKERDMCEQGWNECLDKLADYLRKEPGTASV